MPSQKLSSLSYNKRSATQNLNDNFRLALNECKRQEKSEISGDSKFSKQSADIGIIKREKKKSSLSQGHLSLISKHKSGSVKISE